ncbi:P-loop ATPase, Sll1717 family [Salipaludibacillus sp. HK11]|uniref:P-loop ATPase, Sll1717 family n=1 Tax=Salipaludibacillus sp. HK11 TaxID=3394320 RepID=UPI0039FCAA3F
MSIKGFYAYPSEPKDLNETIENCIEKINSAGFQLKSWKSLRVQGNVIIEEIINEIDESDLFFCDLTYLNFNVLFELGYAIGRNKKIFVSINDNIKNAVREYQKLNLLTNVGFSTYSNSSDIFEAFLKEKPWEDKDKTLIKSIMTNVTPKSDKLFYVKSPIDTEASAKLSIEIKHSELASIVDDPKEGTPQNLKWYIESVLGSVGTVIQLLSNSHQDNEIMNAKNSFLGGLAKGLGVNVIMLAHNPFFKPPIDYIDILKVHSTAQECTDFIKEWLLNVEDRYLERKSDYGEHLQKEKAMNKLKNLFIGQAVAENESSELVDYFVETREYREALNSQQTLFVGRKGTGKTANLYKIANVLSEDKRNFVCIIQPVGHEIEGVINMLRQSIPKSEKGYLVESIWKYLIYTELAKSFYEYIDNQPKHIGFSPEEVELIDFVKTHEKMINADFTLRLENAVNSLCALDKHESIDAQRVKVSEILHEKMISQLRKKLGEVLKDKNKVSILIDNLDAAWKNDKSIGDLSEFLFGLINITRKITDEFKKSDFRYSSVNLSLIAFLRSDIFRQLLPFVGERDKIPHSKLVWKDRDLLFRIIEDRIEFSLDTITSPDELWNDYFCDSVNEKSLKDYVMGLIIPRPRDIIYLFNAAIEEAVNRGHTKVEEKDFISAEEKYSHYAFNSVLAEQGNSIESLESLLYEFVGEPCIINKIELEEILKRANVYNTEETIDLICELTFIGLETRLNHFEYINEDRPKQVYYRLAEKISLKRKEPQRYYINDAFHAYLGIAKIHLEA